MKKKKMEMLSFFSRILKWIAWRGAEEKRNMSKSSAVPMCSFREFQELMKSKEGNLGGSYFCVSPGLARGFLLHKEGSFYLFCLQVKWQ